MQIYCISLGTNVTLLLDGIEIYRFFLNSFEVNFALFFEVKKFCFREAFYYIIFHINQIELNFSFGVRPYAKFEIKYKRGNGQ